ncbi:hypothetical protein Pmani_017722 [Petrolisthes manimaculis]|uniref:Uncharacterized protein n=1 Tax=Petrolisthes manimaculis TaxID=1843537 RepID=A0AAE1PMT8_9EUCA|nr:hypothetical protein Pmani_017722 [Petrolisthes manimaculis]
MWPSSERNGVNVGPGESVRGSIQCDLVTAFTGRDGSVVSCSTHTGEGGRRDTQGKRKGKGRKEGHSR